MFQKLQPQLKKILELDLKDIFLYLHTTDTKEETSIKSTKLFVNGENWVDDSLQQKNIASNILFIAELLQNPKL